MELTTLSSLELTAAMQQKKLKENSAMHFSVAPMLDWMDGKIFFF